MAAPQPDAGSGRPPAPDPAPPDDDRPHDHRAGEGRTSDGRTSEDSLPQRVRFGPDHLSLVPVLILLLGTLPLAGSSPWLTGLLLVPLVCAVWVVRARVVVAPAGVEVCNGLTVHRLPWAQVEGFAVPPRWPVRLLRAGGSPLPLTALPRRQLPALREAAQRLGRPVPGPSAT